MGDASLLNAQLTGFLEDGLSALLKACQKGHDPCFDFLWLHLRRVLGVHQVWRTAAPLLALRWGAARPLPEQAPAGCS